MDVSASYFIETINIPSFLFGLVTLLLVLWLLTRSKYNYNLPPGPTTFPIIGNLLQFVRAKSLFVKIRDLRKQYGDIFKLKVGSDIMVFVCKTELILEGLVKKGYELKGRPYWIYVFDKVFQKKGIFFNVGKEWKDAKKFTISTLRDLVNANRGLDKQIYLETLKLSEHFQSHNGKPFSLGEPVAHLALSTMHYMLFGERIKHGNQELQEILDDLRFFFNTVSGVIPENFLPFLRFLRWNSPVGRIIKNDKKIRNYVKRKIMEHKNTFKAEYMRDFIDMYIQTIEKEPNSESFYEANMFRAIVDIFGGGIDTTATALNWAFLFMAKYPDIQNKCREEIKQITNLNRPITMEDKQHMKYVAATLLEVQRIAPVGPMTAPHTAEVDTTLGGYDIPKHTVVLFLLIDAHFDPNYWDNPEEFLPERWIGENNELKKNEAFMPFSAGPRICAGVSVANIEIFITFTNILQKFKLERPDETPMTIEGRQSGLINTPVNDNIRAISL